MKIGYISSYIYRHTFEINEVVELLRQSPGTRVYSFYPPRGSEIQSKRIQEIPVEIISWSVASVLGGLLRLMTSHPVGFLRGAIRLAIFSIPNPIYWVKNFITFLIAAPILADADRYGVTHLHANFGSSPATIAWLGKVILRTRMSVTFHAFDIYAHSLGQRDPIKKQKLRDADVVVVAHYHGLEYLRTLVPEVNEEKFKMIRISVVFKPEEKPSALPDPPLFVAAGNLVPKKGFDVLIRAAGILRRDGVSIRLRILGEGSERERLEALVRSEGVGDWTELPGYYQHADLAGSLAEAAALVVPSKVVKGGQRDGIPTVLVEAWLARTPVVASLVGGMADVLVDGDTGLAFPPDNPEALASCLRRLVESEQLRQKLVEQGLRAAESEFSPGRNVTSLIEEIRAASTS